MTSHRARAAEELQAVADPTGRLGAVLRAATAPAHADELAGEGAAMAAYRAAATLVAPRPSRFRRAMAKFLTVKAVIVVTVVGSTGVVVAATGGVLPGPWSAPGPPPAEQPSVTTPAPSDEVPSPPWREEPHGTPADKPKPVDPGKPGNPSGDKDDVRDDGQVGDQGDHDDARDDPDDRDAQDPDDDQGDDSDDKPDKPPKSGKPADPPDDKKDPSRDAGTSPTPVSPTRGVTTPVPPSDTTPPSQGG